MSDTMAQSANNTTPVEYQFGHNNDLFTYTTQFYKETSTTGKTTIIHTITKAVAASDIQYLDDPLSIVQNYLQQRNQNKTTAMRPATPHHSPQSPPPQSQHDHLSQDNNPTSMSERSQTSTNFLLNLQFPNDQLQTVREVVAELLCHFTKRAALTAMAFGVYGDRQYSKDKGTLTYVPGSKHHIELLI